MLGSADARAWARVTRVLPTPLGWKLIMQWCGYMLVELASLILPDVQFGTVSLD